MILYGHMSPMITFGMIGAIKSGCGYVLLILLFPKERVNMIIDKSTTGNHFYTSDETLEQTNTNA